MKDRQDSKVQLPPLPPLPKGRAAYAPSEAEWDKIRETVPAKKRIRVALELELNPLQYQALLWQSRVLFVTPSELATVALVADLDGYNNTERLRYLTYSLAEVLTQFPEREKDLGDLYAAYEKQDDAVRKSSKEIRAAEAKLEQHGLAVAS